MFRSNMLTELFNDVKTNATEKTASVLIEYNIINLIDLQYCKSNIHHPLALEGNICLWQLIAPLFPPPS